MRDFADCTGGSGRSALPGERGGLNAAGSCNAAFAATCRRFSAAYKRAANLLLATTSKDGSVALARVSDGGGVSAGVVCFWATPLSTLTFARDFNSS